MEVLEKTRYLPAVVVLLVLLTGCACQCPLDTRVEEADPGCDLCTCCRFLSGGYQVSCTSERLTAIPDLSRQVTHLFLINTSITRLDDSSFPPLPRLNTLLLGPKSPITQIKARTFQQFPNLTMMYLHLSLNKVEAFLDSTQVSDLIVICAKPMTKSEFRTMIGKTQNLTVYNCSETDFPLDESSYNVPPKKVVVHLIDNSTTFVDSLNVKLPGSQVEVHFDYIEKTPEHCLAVHEVSAKTLLISCQVSSLRIDSNQLDWVDRTSARVSLHIYYHGLYDRFLLGNHSFYSLKLEIPKQVVTVYDKPTWQQFNEDLLHSMNTTSVQRLSCIRPPVIGVNILTSKVPG